MNRKINCLSLTKMALASFVLCLAVPLVSADEPCPGGLVMGEELGECRVLIEINATDGDIGLHALFDGEGWTTAQIFDNNSNMIFEEMVTDGASAALGTQQMTENFFESTEPLCEEELAEEEETVRTLTEFLGLFPAGDYHFSLDGGDVGLQTGTTTLTHIIPAAPADVDFDGKHITWAYGDDLGECTTMPASGGDFEIAEEEDIIGYEVVLEPEDDELGPFSFSIRVPADVNKVTVPKE